MNLVYEVFTEKFRVIDYFYKHNCLIEKKPGTFEIHVVTDKIFDADFELLRLNKLFEKHMFRVMINLDLQIILVLKNMGMRLEFGFEIDNILGNVINEENAQSIFAILKEPSLYKILRYCCSNTAGYNCYGTDERYDCTLIKFVNEEFRI